MFYLYLIVFSILGIMMPSMSIYSLIIKPIKLNIYRKRHNIEIKRNVKEKNRLPDIIFFVTFIGIISALSIWSLITVLPYWQDVPNEILNNYSLKSGTVDNIWIGGDKGKNWGYDTISIGGKIYRFHNMDIPNRGVKVSIEYLSHTKIIKIMEIYR